MRQVVDTRDPLDAVTLHLNVASRAPDPRAKERVPAGPLVSSILTRPTRSFWLSVKTTWSSIDVIDFKKRPTTASSLSTISEKRLWISDTGTALGYWHKFSSGGMEIRTRLSPLFYCERLGDRFGEVNVPRYLGRICWCQRRLL